jgi:hypothetical protein
LTIGDAGAIGRHTLAVKTGLGEGAVRTVIKWLKEDGYIATDAGGCRLAAKGKKAYAEIKSAIPNTIELSKTPLTVGREQVALLVKNKANRVKSGIEQRDSAIRAGAAGATTYVIRGAKFQVPGSSMDSEKDFPGPGWTKLRSSLEPDDGDVVIVCGSEDRNASRLGAISAAFTLLV